MSLALLVHSSVTRMAPLSFLLSSQRVAGSETKVRSQRDLSTQFRKEAHFVVHENMPGSCDGRDDDHRDEGE